MGYIELIYRHDIQDILCLVSLCAMYNSQCALHTFSTGPLAQYSLASPLFSVFLQWVRGHLGFL
jgi:hypothetical protein